MQRFFLRATSGLLLLAGLAALTAAAAAFSILPSTSSARPIATLVVQMAVILMAGGLATKFALRTPHVPDVTPLPIVRILVGIALVAVPVWMVLTLEPFLEEWRYLYELGEKVGVWDEVSSNVGGYLLIPIAAALAPPFIELLTMAAFIVASAALLVPILRGAPVSRLYLAWMLVLSTMVFVSVRGADAAAVAAAVARGGVAGSSRGGDEAAQILGFVERYDNAVQAAKAVLRWTAVGYVIWIPAIFILRRR